MWNAVNVSNCMHCYFVIHKTRSNIVVVAWQIGMCYSPVGIRAYTATYAFRIHVDNAHQLANAIFP